MQETQETQVQSLGQEDPLEKGMATHSNLLAWRIPWTEEPSRLPPCGTPRAGLRKYLQGGQPVQLLALAGLLFGFLKLISLVTFLHLFPLLYSVVVDGKESVRNAGGLGLTPGSGISSGEGHGNPLQYSCLENPKDRGSWKATVHGVAKSWTWLSTHTGRLRH